MPYETFENELHSEQQKEKPPLCSLLLVVEQRKLRLRRSCDFGQISKVYKLEDAAEIVHVADAERCAAFAFNDLIFGYFSSKEK